MSDKAGSVDLESTDVAAAKRAAFEDLFPGVLADGVLDATRLGELLDTPVAALAEGRERFGLMWAGKQDAVRSLLAPSRGALIPDFDRSVAFDSATNVFIEGDNFEVLKLLQKAYNDQVKLIYIDPPYNTGSDFVYGDDFADGMRAYLKFTGQSDADGNRVSALTDTVGRHHSRWLSMMYPRLILARNLLTQDGVIFISIDDNEYANLKALMDEIFGPENALGCITVVSNLKGRSDDKYFATSHNYLLAYQRANFAPRGVPLPQSYRDDYPETDIEGNRFRLLGLRKRGDSARREDRPSMHYAFYVDPASGAVSLERQGPCLVEVLPKLSDGSDGRWRWGRDTAGARLGELMARQVGSLRRWDVFQVDQLFREGAERRAIPKTIWDGPEMANEAGTIELKRLLGKRVFETPKPTGLIRQILEHSVGKDDLVLDFFAGSGSTAHAVALMNADDGGQRRIISVNIQEPTPESSNARQAGFETVSSITWARIRALIDEIPTARQQGVRTFTLKTSCFRDASAAALDNLFDMHESTLEEGDRVMEELAAEVLLKEGVPLDVHWNRQKAGEASVIVADGVAVVMCLDITDEVATAALALGSRVVVFLEDGFAGKDSVKANVFTNAKNLGITMKTV